MMLSNAEREKGLASLVTAGLLTEEQLRSAAVSARARGIELERVLLREYRLPKDKVLKVLSECYHCHSIQYDERLPVPPELLAGPDGEPLTPNRWFPLIRDEDHAIIAAADPEDPAISEEVEDARPGKGRTFWVALEEDLRWFRQDFLHAKPGALIGTERTNLAFWRNNMAHWRTRLACYRTDLAKGRTDLAVLRWGFGLIALSNALMRLPVASSIPFYPVFWVLMMATGFSFSIVGLNGYFKIRTSRITPPREQTLVEVTAATTHFLENYHFPEQQTPAVASRGTMLARLGDSLLHHCTLLYPPPASLVRTHLVHQKNVLAAQRTVAACYRTLYARARTGLAFIRSGVSFASLGLGLMHYFVFSFLTVFDVLLLIAGLFLVVDGLIWYLPVRKEQAETPGCFLDHP
jgi:uncharacterized membrane protein YidH (DUF202 family)